MKNTSFSILIFIFCFANINAQVVTIPDANFKNILVTDTSINTNIDTEIQVSEAQAFTGTINVSSANIASLVGIEAFINLTGLDCSYNQLTSLDISTNTALTSLICVNNQLGALNLNNNTALTTLDCGFNQLPDLNTNNNTLLASLTCNNNQLASLGLNSNTALKKLICSSNQLPGLNINSNILLDTINCSFNQITSLDFSSNSALMNIQIQHNALTTIDMGVISNVVDFVCYNNQLSSLDVSNCTALNSIQCNNNNLSGLDISSCPSLIACWCYNNNLEYLNVQNGNNTNFTDFDAQTNPLLTCIMVDSVAFSTANWTLIPSVASFSTFCTALAIKELKQKNISIYPNPANKELNILLENNIVATSYSIINMDGKEIINKPWSSTIINIETLLKGIYILRIHSKENTILNKKFVVN